MNGSGSGPTVGATVGAALIGVVRLARLLHGGDLYALDVVGREARLRYVSPYDRRSKLGGPAAEAALVFAHQLGRSIALDAWAPTAVRFQHARGAGSLEQLFGAPVSFSSRRTELVVDAAVLDLAVKGSTADLFCALEHHLTTVAESAPVPGGVAEMVRKAMRAGIDAGVPALELVAQRVGLSPRVLQARLNAEHTSYQAILDTVREDLAKHHLEQDRLSLPDIALLLGYSEASAFHRAFKRWTGVTPGDYRRSRAR